MQKGLRIGREIKAEEVRVIDEKNNHLGVMKISEALRIAEEKGLSLIEINPNSNPPVCKIADIGKFLYEIKKKEKEAKKKQKETEVKELRLNPTIQKYDLQMKLEKAREWLQNGKVKITIMLKGRTILHPDVGFNIFKEIENMLEFEYEQKPKLEGRNIVAVIRKKKS